MGRKHCEKRRNCLLRAISSFSIVFSKDMYCRHRKNQSLFRKGLTYTKEYKHGVELFGVETLHGFPLKFVLCFLFIFQMTIIYSCIARGTTILCSHGNQGGINANYEQAAESVLPSIPTRNDGKTTITANRSLLDNTVLTLSQMTNFRLFQMERVCRRQFQIC